MTSTTELQVLISAKDEATPALKGLSETLSANKETLLAVGAAAGIAFAGIASFAKSSIDAANESASVQAQLDAVLKSTGDTVSHTSQIFVQGSGSVVVAQNESAKAVKAHAKEVKANATELLQAQQHLKTYQNELESTTARVSDMSKELTNGKVKTASWNAQYDLAKKKVVDLKENIALATSEISKHSTVTSSTTNVIKGHYETVTKAAEFTRQGLIDLSKSLEQTTTFSDEAVLSTENLLLTFTAIGKNTMPGATQAVLDMSTALGEDTKSAAIQLGKALQDPIKGITALRRVGVDFNDDQKSVITALVKTGQTAKAQQIILAELNKEFGGSAAAAAETYAGKQKQLENQINDVQETIGNQLIPILTQVVSAIVPIITSVGKWIEQHPTLTRNIILLAGGLTGLVTLITAVAGAMVVLNAVSLPIVGSILAITAVIAGVVLIAYNLYNIIQDLSTFWPETWLGIKIISQEVFSDILGFIQPIIDAFNKIISLASQVGSAVSGIVGKAGSVVSGAVSSVTNAITGKRASGGTVFSGSSYLVGENGPEIFSPAFSGSIQPNGGSGGGGVVININGGTYLSQDAANKLGNMIVDQLKRRTRLGL